MLVYPMSTTDCIIHNDKKLTLLISLVTEKSKMESVCYYSGDLVGMPEQTQQIPFYHTQPHSKNPIPPQYQFTSWRAYLIMVLLIPMRIQGLGDKLSTCSEGRGLSPFCRWGSEDIKVFTQDSELYSSRWHG